MKSMKRRELASLPIRIKLLLVMLASVALIMIANLIMYLNINQFSRHLDEIYSGNVQLSELERAHKDLQGAVTVYMNTRTTDTLQDYYEKEQVFSDLVGELSGNITDNELSVMECNIRNLSESYLQLTSRTIEARRGRNVEKYRGYYEECLRVGGYLAEYITALNNRRFAINTESYKSFSMSLTYLEKSSALIFVLIAVFDILFVLMMTRTVTDPLLALSAAADRVADGKLDEVGTLPVRAMDEVGIVTVAFNQMVSSIPGYLERLRKSMESERRHKERELLMEAHLKDARLKYLQAQINPHFLFNTLNAGAQLAFLEGADKTQTYVQKVADFFRYNISKENEDVTLADEIAMVDTYMYIINVRFSGDIHFEKQIEDDSLLSLYVPSMILQPIVENSVKYGVRELAGEGRIDLSVFSVDDTVCISITDNGIGMTQERIDSVLSGRKDQSDEGTDPEGGSTGSGSEGSGSHPASGSTENRQGAGDDTGNGVGLYNVMQRLSLYFKGKNRFEIISPGPGQGTEVVITIPWKEKHSAVLK